MKKSLFFIMVLATCLIALPLVAMACDPVTGEGCGIIDPICLDCNDITPEPMPPQVTVVANVDINTELTSHHHPEICDVSSYFGAEQNGAGAISIDPGEFETNGAVNLQAAQYITNTETATVQGYSSEQTGIIYQMVDISAEGLNAGAVFDQADNSYALNEVADNGLTSSLGTNTCFSAYAYGDTTNIMASGINFMGYSIESPDGNTWQTAIGSTEFSINLPSTD